MFLHVQNRKENKNKGIRTKDTNEIERGNFKINKVTRDFSTNNYLIKLLTSLKTNLT